MDNICRRTALGYPTLSTLTNKGAARGNCKRHRRGKPPDCHLIGKKVVLRPIDGQKCREELSSNTDLMETMFAVYQ